MSDVIAHISPQRLQEVVAEFDPDTMNAALVASLSREYPPSAAIIQAIADTMTESMPAVSGAPATPPLEKDDRERILIALLAARGERLNLAVHIYYALGLEISPDEIVHILLLAGIYAGLPAFASALEVAQDTFDLLENQPRTMLEPLHVLLALKSAFDLPPPSPH